MTHLKDSHFWKSALSWCHKGWWQPSFFVFCFLLACKTFLLQEAVNDGLTATFLQIQRGHFLHFMCSRSAGVLEPRTQMFRCELPLTLPHLSTCRSLRWFSNLLKIKKTTWCSASRQRILGQAALAPPAPPPSPCWSADPDQTASCASACATSVRFPRNQPPSLLLLTHTCVCAHAHAHASSWPSSAFSLLQLLPLLKIPSFLTLLIPPTAAVRLRTSRFSQADCTLHSSWEIWS